MGELLLTQRLEPKEQYASVFKKTERQAKKSGLMPHLDALAEKSGWRGGMDWLLTYMRPEFKTLVLNYYLGNIGRFAEEFPLLVKPLDKMMCKALTSAGFIP